MDITGKKQLDSMVKMLTQGKYESRYETPDDSQLVLVVEYDGNEILRHASEKGLVLDDLTIRMFGNSVLNRFVSLGLQKQCELSMGL
jgi:hypothetical protein